MTRPVLLLGGGGHALSVADALQALGRTVYGVVDPNPDSIHPLLKDLPFLGGDGAILAIDPEAVELACAVGSTGPPEARARLYAQLADRGYRFATIIHPSASVSVSAELGMGVQVMAGAVVQAAVRVGANSLINTRASIDHSCDVGAHVHLAPGVTLSGDVTVGDLAHIGTGAVVIQGLRIGAGAFVAAGAVVIRDVPDRVRVQGVPARERSS